MSDTFDLSVFDSAIEDFHRRNMLIFKPGEPHVFYPKENVIPPIKKVIFNPPATIVFWDDGEKTVVKCKESEEFDYECGLAFAIAKRYFGSRSEFKKAIGNAKKITSGRDTYGFKRKNVAADVAAKIHSNITGAELRMTNNYINERLRDYWSMTRH